MTTKKKTSEGDIFLIPIDDSRNGLGQVIARYKETELFYFAAFDEVIPIGSEPPLPSEVKDFSILFLANTFDVLIQAGDWPVVGNAEPRREDFPFPFYKVAQGGKYIVESWDCSLRRKAKKKEIDRLDFRSGIAPIRLQKAVQAHFGVRSWHPSFDTLLFDYVAQRSTL